MKLMQPGKLRHSLTIEKPTVAITANGEASRTWSTHANAWGSVQQVPGREIVNESDSMEGRATHRVKVWAVDADGVTVNMRINWSDESRIFNINRPPVADWTNEMYYWLYCEEVAAGG